MQIVTATDAQQWCKNCVPYVCNALKVGEETHVLPRGSLLCLPQSMKLDVPREAKQEAAFCTFWEISGWSLYFGNGEEESLPLTDVIRAVAAEVYVLLY